ncbi:alpha amylase N-terminal ig-like domain-containing protein [Poriferisphaera corsica]|uniref:alpha amylase N-terminal ig-like domain-containing protein n=1 Tax=Poriferisphaera corsica TaxID=2528020 RepID=UPI00190C0D93|nr:alpha amylase N-terminal ig-like domain-containing protein [Poriferisphaera corsica]
MFLAVLFSIASLASAAQNVVQHTFRFVAPHDAQVVSVIGSFNNWDPDAGVMIDEGQDIWSVTLPVSEGVHHYKFVVNNTKYFEDPTADAKLTEGDGHGGRNSGIAIGIAAEKVQLSDSQFENVLGEVSALTGKDILLPDGKYLHKFVYIPSKFIKEKINTVVLAGSMNGWSKDKTPMQDIGNGVYQIELPLEKGVHFYKFVVNNNRWMNDPASDKEFEMSDGNTGVNSAVFIGPDGRKLSKPKPNHINTAAVAIDGFSIFRSNHALIRIRVQAKDATAANLYYAPAQFNDVWQSLPMNLSESAMGFDVYSVDADSASDEIQFIFEIIDGNQSIYLSNSGIHQSLVKAKAAAFKRSMAFDFFVPEWTHKAIWYQIFPERFRNGDPSNDPKLTKRWTSEWFSMLPGEKGTMDDFYTGVGNVWWRKYGGDIQGLREALPYLRKLGVNAIYLNPVFEAESMHKYDATDYRHIDDNFGVKGDIEKLKGESLEPSTWQWSETDKMFLEFIDEAHKQGFKVIIDGVFNHVGPKHFAFQDVLKNGKDSIYAEWFDITDWGTGGEPGKPGGLQWNGWGGKNSGLPAWKKDPVLGLADAPSQHIFDITRRWMAPNGDVSRGIDGWRLDAPNDVPHAFWKRWRKVVKDINPDAYISGEIWHWAQDYLQGDEFDAVMNYLFAQAAQDFFVDVETQIKPTELATRLNRIIYNYPLQVSLAQQNLFDSHDTDRFSSMFVNPDISYDGANRLQDNGPDYNPRKPSALEYKRMIQAFAFQMTFVGAPMIYYGNEAGMYSPDDPSNRQPMTWPGMKFDDPEVGFNPEIFASTQKLIAVRRKLPALQTGLYRQLIADDDRNIFSFIRENEQGRVYILINRSNTDYTIEVPVDLRDANINFVNVLGQNQTTLTTGNTPDARPELALTKAAKSQKPTNGSLIISVPAYETAVLVDINNMK